jgi:hypothetical protein
MTATVETKNRPAGITAEPSTSEYRAWLALQRWEAEGGAVGSQPASNSSIWLIADDAPSTTPMSNTCCSASADAYVLT